MSGEWQTICDKRTPTHNLFSKQFGKGRTWVNDCQISLIFGPTSNSGLTRKGQIFSPTNHKRCPTFQTAHLQLPVSTTSNQRKMNTFPGFLLLWAFPLPSAFESLPNTGDGGWLHCYNKLQLNGLYFSHFSGSPCFPQELVFDNRISKL